MDVRGKRVLIFGDSLSQRGGRDAPVVFNVTQGSNRTSSVPGDLVGSHLLEAGAAAVRVNAKVSRSAYNFFRVEDGNALLRADQLWKPDVVILVLGTNDLGLGQAADEQALRAIYSAYKAVGADVWSIGPPSFARADLTTKTPTVVSTFSKVIGIDRFIDGRSLTADLTATGQFRSVNDGGVHFTSTGAKIFAARMAQALLGKMPSGQAVPTSPPAPPTTSTLPSSGGSHAFAIGLGVGGIAVAVALGLRLIIRRRNRLMT